MTFHNLPMTLFPGDEIVVVLNEGVKVTGNVLLTLKFW
jgi:hypothetical protein